MTSMYVPNGYWEDYFNDIDSDEVEPAPIEPEEKIELLSWQQDIERSVGLICTDGDAQGIQTITRIVEEFEGKNYNEKLLFEKLWDAFRKALGSSDKTRQLSAANFKKATKNVSSPPPKWVSEIFSRIEKS